MKTEYKEVIVFSIIIAIITIALGIVLEYKPGIPFYFTGIVGLFVEILLLIIVIMKKLNDFDK